MRKISVILLTVMSTGLLVWAGCTDALHAVNPAAMEVHTPNITRDTWHGQDTVLTDRIGDSNVPDVARDVHTRDTNDNLAGHDEGIPVVTDDNCKPCASNADCSRGYECISLPGGKACLKQCKDNGDCISGYICYASSREDKNCVPPSYKCVKCAFQGCPKGKVCDLSNGRCVDKVPVCGICTMDWQCGIGSRCYRDDPFSKGVCMPECKSVFDCPNPKGKYTCGIYSGIKVCRPVDTGVCCPADRPHMLADGTCVQCVKASDCANDQYCDTKTHTCTAGCPADQKRCSDDNRCHQCCTNADCASGKQCRSHTCIDPGNDPCHGACTDPNYSYCVNYQGQWTCASCDPDVPDSCPSGCSCDPDSYTCLTPDGSVCGCDGCIDGCAAHLRCTRDDDCYSPNGQPLKCDPQGFCYDPSGSCDNEQTCCNEVSGSKCFDLMTLLFNGLPGQPGVTGGITMGVCTCDNGAKCPDGLKCYPLDIVCTMPNVGEVLCPNGKLPQNAPRHICKDPRSLFTQK